MDMTVNLRASQLLERALERMNEEGRHWVKGNYRRLLENGEYGYCAIGSIDNDQKADGVASYHAVRALNAARSGYSLDRATGARSLIVTWNDSTKTTWEDVKTVFTRAIKLLKQQ
jgi:hypothetical protein